MTKAARYPQYLLGNQYMPWIRAQPELASSLGFTITDIDCVVRDYKRKMIMVIEFKCRMAKPDYPQHQTLQVLHLALRIGVPLVGWIYKGTHLIQFENESPTDGRIYIDGNEVDQAGLLRFLAFE